MGALRSTRKQLVTGLLSNANIRAPKYKVKVYGISHGTPGSGTKGVVGVLLEAHDLRAAHHRHAKVARKGAFSGTTITDL